MRTRGWTAWTVAALAFLVLPACPAGAQEPETGDGYAAGTYGRIRWAQDGVRLVRAEAEDGGREEQAGLNSPIFPDDRLETDGRQRAEVQLAGGTLIRVDLGTALRFTALPDPYAENPDHAVLGLESGGIEVRSRLKEREEFRIDTPAASVYLVGSGTFRIDIGPRGQTEVRSRRGVAEVVGDGGSVLVRAGMRTTVEPGDLPEDVVAFNTYQRDDFDRWCDDRESGWRARQVYEVDDLDVQDLPATVQPYYGELSGYGRWTYASDYGGWVWYPVGMAATWRPYMDGYWSWGPGGYFWVSYEPWGWAPYRYGRWNYIPAYGWAWTPGSVFGGAWVSWSWGSAYIGWAPLGYWNYPVAYGPMYYDYYDPHCWSFVHYDHFHGHHGHHYDHYYEPWDHVRTQVRHHAVVTRPPAVPPTRLVRDSAEVRERRVREMREDRRAALRPPTGARPTRSFRDAERAPVRRERDAVVDRAPAGRPRTATARPSPGTSTRDERPALGNARERIERAAPAPDRGRGTAARPAAPREAARPEVRERPRQLTAPRSPAPAERGTGSGSSERRDDRGRPEVRERPRPAEPRREDDAQQRLREMYRNLQPSRTPREADRPSQARPAEPRPAPRPEARPAPAPRTQPSRPEARPAPAPAAPAPRAEPRGGGSGRGSDARPAPKKDDGKSGGGGGHGRKR